MARRPTAKAELDRLVAAVAGLQQELVRIRASRTCLCLACTGGLLAFGGRCCISRRAGTVDGACVVFRGLGRVR
jgi:hypothetical protein